MKKRPVDELAVLRAPRELTEWVRKLPPDAAARLAWVDAQRADWMPYLAVLRGFRPDAVLSATCQCALELARGLEGPEAARVIALLEATSERGPSALATAEADLADLRLAIVAWGHRTQPIARPPWMHWAELVLELARAASRGNVLLGAAQAMKMLAHVNTRGKPGARPAHSDLVARFRDKIMLAG